MPLAIASFLLALGCSHTAIITPAGPVAMVWVCPPVEADKAPETQPEAAPKEEREG